MILLHLSSKLVSISYLKQSYTFTHFLSWNPENNFIFEILIQYFHLDMKNPFSMINSTFKDILFLGVLNWVTVHSQTEKYLEIIFTPHDEKVKTCCSLVVQLKVLNFKTNKLLKEKGYPRPVQMMMMEF